MLKVDVKVFKPSESFHSSHKQFPFSVPNGLHMPINSHVMFNSHKWTFSPAKDCWLGPGGSDKPSVWPGWPEQIGWDPPAPHDLIGCLGQIHRLDMRPIGQRQKHMLLQLPSAL